MRPRIESIVDELLDAAVPSADGSIDLVPTLAFPLPAIVIAELLGVEHSSVRSIAHRALHRLRKELE